jgi:hypothetical protein
MNRFFRIIWRFNALIIALVGVLAFAVLLFVATLLLNEYLAPYYASSSMVNIDDSAEIEEHWWLGESTRMPGSNVLALPLYMEQAYEIGYGSGKEISATRNLLFIHPDSGESHWLLDNHRGLIDSWHILYPGNDDDNKDAVGILYMVVAADTTADARLTASDNKQVYLGDVQGKHLTPVIHDVERVIGYEVLNEQHLFISYRQQQQGFAMIVSITDATVIKRFELPALPGKVLNR